MQQKKDNERATQRGTQPEKQDTIIALASGGGRAGVAVVRVSGPKAGAVLLLLSGSEHMPPSRQMCMRRLRDPLNDDLPLDDALVVWMPAPRSYTGENVAEFHLHGSVAVVDAVVSAALASANCRRAEPGEFTRRAVENGRLGLSRAEGVADLIEAETENQRRAAFRLYDGEAEQVFATWRAGLIDACAALEAGIDFADEADVGAHMADEAARAIKNVGGAIRQVLSDASRARAIRCGYRVAVVGPPNVGKSSLVNVLAGRDAAMVSTVPGTTRDVVEVRLILAGYPVWVADTAGLRAATDSLEAEGVARARAALESADLRIWVADASEGDDAARAVFAAARNRDFLVVNKIDLATPELTESRALCISTRTGTGIDGLCEALASRVDSELGGEVSPLSAHARHRELLTATNERITRAEEVLKNGEGAEVAAEEMRRAAGILSQLIGSVGSEDWLDRIFHRFCIGK